MSWDNQSQSVGQTQAVEVDEGLRSYMLGIYNYMASALLLTGLVAYFAASYEPFVQLMQTSPLRYVVIFAPLAFVFFLGFKINTMSMKAAQISFWGFATIMGASLYYVFAYYAGVDIIRAFFITAATFGAMSLYGYTTKKNLSGWGTFLHMGVIGLIIASVVNMFFLQSTMFHYVTSIISVLIFSGLVAYDTQKMKNIYYSVAGNADAMARATIIGALSLYIDVIVIFQNMLHLTSGD